MAGPNILGGGLVGAARDRVRGVFTGVRNTVDKAMDQNIAAAAKDGVLGFFEKNGEFRRDVTRR